MDACIEGHARAGPGRLRLKNTDVFAGVNVALFLLMCAFVYARSYLRYHVVANVYEFLFYAVVILAAIAVCWRYFRPVAFPTWVLALMQLGILAHFAGGFVTVNGARLYDTQVLFLPFDKWVHGFNAFAGGAVVSQLIEPSRSHPRLRPAIILLIVQGCGGVVEICEYLAKVNLQSVGVGDYDNNMQDLVANFVGVSLYLAAAGVASLGARYLRRRVA